MAICRRAAPRPNPCFGPVVLADGSVFIPTGPPMLHNVHGAFRRNPEHKIGLRDYAQIIAGLGKGKAGKTVLRSLLPYATQGGREMRPKDVRDYVMGLRVDQLNDVGEPLGADAGATIIPQKGVWQGGQESSITLLIINDGRTNENRKTFEHNVRRLALQIAETLGQSVVFLTLYRKGVPTFAYEMQHHLYSAWLKREEAKKRRRQK